MPKQIDFKPRKTPSKKTSAKRAVPPRKAVKTAKTASKAPKTAKSTVKTSSATTIKVNFGPKKATVKRKTISVVETPDVPPKVETFEETREIPIEHPEDLVAEPDLAPEPEASADLDLEEVFDELEAEQNAAVNQNLFDDFENPLDIQQENFIAEPEPLELDQIEETAEQGLLDDFAGAPAEVVKTPAPPSRQPNSPFLTAVKVEKRPLSGGAYQASRTTIAQFTAAPTEGSNPLVEDTPAKRETPTTVIDAAPKKGSGTLGLLMAILATVIAGGVVGAMIYFIFFQE